MNKNWRSISVPEKMKNLPLTKFGMVIPYNIFVDEEGQEHFVVNDHMKTEACLTLGLCSICGQKLEKDIWLTGGARNAFHPNGAYIDPPMHYDCVTYALRVCPFLASRNYNVMKHDLEAIKDKMKCEPMVLLDPTVDANRPKVFVLIKVLGYELHSSSQSGREQFYIVANRPYLEIEYWDKGERISLEKAMPFLAFQGLTGREGYASR